MSWSALWAGEPQTQTVQSSGSFCCLIYFQWCRKTYCLCHLLGVVCFFCLGVWLPGSFSCCLWDLVPLPDWFCCICFCSELGGANYYELSNSPLKGAASARNFQEFSSRGRARLQLWFAQAWLPSLAVGFAEPAIWPGRGLEEGTTPVLGTQHRFCHASSSGDRLSASAYVCFGSGASFTVWVVGFLLTVLQSLQELDSEFESASLAAKAGHWLSRNRSQKHSDSLALLLLCIGFGSPHSSCHGFTFFGGRSTLLTLTAEQVGSTQTMTKRIWTIIRAPFLNLFGGWNHATSALPGSNRPVVSYSCQAWRVARADFWHVPRHRELWANTFGIARLLLFLGSSACSRAEALLIFQCNKTSFQTSLNLCRFIAIDAECAHTLVYTGQQSNILKTQESRDYNRIF